MEIKDLIERKKEIDVELEEIKKLLGLSEKITCGESNNLDGCYNGRYCIIRSYSSGVHCGIVKNEYKQDVILTDTRRIWRWEGAFTLSKIAQSGFSNADMSVSCPEMKVKRVIEIIPVEKNIEKLLKNWEVHNE